jgi:hypothetical protein
MVCGLLPEPVWMQYREKIIVLDKSQVLFDQPVARNYGDWPVPLSTTSGSLKRYHIIQIHNFYSL